MVLNAAGGGTDLLRCVFLGCVAGSAGNFWPASKGITFENTAAHANAFAVSAFVAGNGFALLDTVVAFIVSQVPSVADKVPAFTVGATINGYLPMTPSQFVIVVTLVNMIVVPHIPGLTLKPGFDVFGAVGKIEKFLRL